MHLSLMLQKLIPNLGIANVEQNYQQQLQELHEELTKAEMEAEEMPDQIRPWHEQLQDKKEHCQELASRSEQITVSVFLLVPNLL